MLQVRTTASLANTPARMFLRLHHEIPGMRIGIENGFGKSGKQRIEDKASKNKPGGIAPGFVVERSLEKRNALASRSASARAAAKLGPATTPTAGQSFAIRMSMAASF